MGKISAADWYRSGRQSDGNKFEGRKGLISRAARRCLERKGVAKTSIADITREVDITRELFYYYYPNKDAVIDAVLDSYVADARVLLTRGIGVVPDEPEALLVQIIRILRAWMSTDSSATVPMLDILRESGRWTTMLYRVAGEALDAVRGTSLLAADDAQTELDACGRKLGLVGAMSAVLCARELSDAEIAQGIAQLFY